MKLTYHKTTVLLQASFNYQGVFLLLIRVLTDFVGTHVARGSVDAAMQLRMLTRTSGPRVRVACVFKVSLALLTVVESGGVLW